MLDSRHSFTKHFRELLEEVAPGVNFYPEPQMQSIQYPCVTLHWGPQRKTNTLAIWASDVQIDILFTEYRRAECDRIVQHILEALNLAADVPGRPRRIPKIRFLDEQGRRLNTPEPYLQGESDIQWRLTEPVQLIYEDDKPELMRNSFTLTLLYKNR
jgi:hypothetical protein